jgi:S1-C subfamily serine protease
MRHIKKSSLIIIAISVAIFGVLAGQNIIGYYSQTSTPNSQTAGSVVYIENGVSGLVTINDPYLNKAVDINVIYNPLDSGSGFIVNSDGYIVTAFHVVGDPSTVVNQGKLKLMNTSDVQRYVERAAVTGYVSRYNPQLGTELINNNTSSNTPMIQSQPNINTTTDIMSQRNLVQVRSSQQIIKVKLPGSINGDSVNANLVDVGNSASSEDVALLKIDLLFKKLPALTISSRNPLNGEKIQIYGYPVVSQDMYSDQNQSIIKPSSTIGVIKTVVPDLETVYYESTATTLHGYSGGPVVDSKNHVLGIIIYSLENNNTPSQTGSSVFLSSQYIINLLNRNNVAINTV